MKKILLLSTVITIFNLAASAQIKKGSLLLGGQISFYNSNTDWKTAQPDEKRRSANFNISAGKALKENSVLGLYIAYTQFKTDNGYNGSSFINSKFERYSFGVFYRQYKKLAKDFYFFGEPGAGYVGSSQADADVSGNNKVKYTQSGGELYLTPGISYQVYKKLQLEFLIPQIVSIRYSVNKTRSQVNNSDQKQFLFNTNLNSSVFSVAVGFKFVL